MQARPAPSLRPMGMGDVIDRVFRMYRDQAAGYFVLAAIPLAALIIVVLIVGSLSVVIWSAFGLPPLFDDSPTSAAPTAPRSSPGLLDVLGVLSWMAGAILLAILVVGMFIAGAVIDAVAAAHLGQSRGIGSSLGAGLRSAPRLFFTSLTVLCALSVFVIVSLIVFSLFYGEIQKYELLNVLVSLVYLFVVFYIQSSWFTAPAVALIERHGPISALRRSWQLARGFHWRLSGLGLLLLVLFVVPFVFVMFVAAFLDIALGRPHIFDSAGMFFAVLFATISAWLPVLFGAMTVVYYDLRVRKEGFDLQVAAEAMLLSGPVGKPL